VLRTTLKQIEVFVAVVQQGGVTHAAAAIGLTQAAASMALAELERQLGAPLFDRVGRRLVLNGDGRSLYPKAVELIERAQELESFLAPGQHAADLRLGASSTVGNYVLPQLMGDFLAVNPQTRLRLEVNNTRRIMDAVRRFEIDIGFVEGPCLDPEIEAIRWREDELAICAAPDHPLAQQTALAPADLRRHGWILREPGSGTREVVDQLLEQQLGQVPLFMELGNTEAIKRAVESGMGIACLPKIALLEAVERGRLICLPTPFLRLTRRFHILLHQQKYRTAGVESFLTHCLQSV
jgi:DNA-binding transcriptional LysR family regulator